MSKFVWLESADGEEVAVNPSLVDYVRLPAKRYVPVAKAALYFSSGAILNVKTDVKTTGRLLSNDVVDV